jgi:hypothetical protein
MYLFCQLCFLGKDCPLLWDTNHTLGIKMNFYNSEDDNDKLQWLSEKHVPGSVLSALSSYSRCFICNSWGSLGGEYSYYCPFKETMTETQSG